MMKQASVLFTVLCTCLLVVALVFTVAPNVQAEESTVITVAADGEKVTIASGDKKVKAVCEVLEFGKESKVVVYKYKAKKNVRKKQGHRQPYTKLKVVSIG